MVFTALFYIFLAYLLYRLVFGFIVPVWRTTRQVKRTFRDMQERMASQMAHPQGQAPAPKAPRPAPSKGTEGEYIDFEEVKE